MLSDYYWSWCVGVKDWKVWTHTLTMRPVPRSVFLNLCSHFKIKAFCNFMLKTWVFQFFFATSLEHFLYGKIHLKQYSTNTVQLKKPVLFTNRSNATFSFFCLHSNSTLFMETRACLKGWTDVNRLCMTLSSLRRMCKRGHSLTRLTTFVLKFWHKQQNSS